MSNVLSPRDLVFRPDNMDETVPNKTSETMLTDSKMLSKARCLFMLLIIIIYVQCFYNRCM